MSDRGGHYRRYVRPCRRRAGTEVQGSIERGAAKHAVARAAINSLAKSFSQPACGSALGAFTKFQPDQPAVNGDATKFNSVAKRQSADGAAVYAVTNHDPAVNGDASKFYSVAFVDRFAACAYAVSAAAPFEHLASIDCGSNQPESHADSLTEFAEQSDAIDDSVPRLVVLFDGKAHGLINAFPDRIVIELECVPVRFFLRPTNDQQGNLDTVLGDEDAVSPEYTDAVAP